MRAPTRLLLVAALCLLARAPASAGDLTGTWKGKWSCKAQNAQGKLKLSSTTVQVPEPGVSTLEITQPDGPDSPALQARIDGVLFAGFSLQPGPALGGVGAFVGCDPGDVRSFRWKVKLDSVQAKISWRSMFVSNDYVISSCRGSWSRVSLEEPAAFIDSCR
jgi:hypothetical protein